MTNRLVALDLPGGPSFVDALRRTWDNGDAALPLDQRLPAPARAALLVAMAPSSIIGPTGAHTELDGGRPVEPGDAVVVATSGSSGDPKGVVLTHEALAASSEVTNSRVDAGPDDHWLACLPLAHIGGLAVVIRALHGGQRLTVLPGFDANAVAASDATLVSLVVTALGRVDPSRFRTIVVGARPPVDPPPNVVSTYGMTESGSGIVYDGVPLDGVGIRIDQHGEIHVRGPMLLRAYRDGTRPESRRLVPDWRPRLVATRRSPAGAGPAGDMIVTGGQNVWPDSVEAILRIVPGVADVVVTGRPDPIWGQAVTALVVPGPGGHRPSTSCVLSSRIDWPRTAHRVRSCSSTRSRAPPSASPVVPNCDRQRPDCESRTARAIGPFGPIAPCRTSDF